MESRGKSHPAVRWPSWPGTTITNLCHGPLLVLRHFAQMAGLGRESAWLRGGKVDGAQAQVSSPQCFISSGVDVPAPQLGREECRKAPGEGRAGDVLLSCNQLALHEINTFVLSSQAPGIWGWSLACQLVYALSHDMNTLLGTYRKLGGGWIVLVQSVIDYPYMTYVIILCYI